MLCYRLLNLNVLLFGFVCDLVVRVIRNRVSDVTSVTDDTGEYLGYRNLKYGYKISLLL